MASELQRQSIEGVVVNSRAHEVSFAGTCLDCGQPDYTARCEPPMLVFPPPALTVPGEVVQP